MIVFGLVKKDVLNWFCVYISKLGVGMGKWFLSGRSVILMGLEILLGFKSCVVVSIW